MTRMKSPGGSSVGTHHPDVEEPVYMREASDPRDYVVYREFDALRRRVALVEQRQIGDWTAPQVKDYIERVLAESQRAIEIAERERELAANALRDALVQSIRDGDDRLREHVQLQVGQIKTALESAELVEQERIANAQQRVSALRTEMALAHEASEKAIAKAETAYETRFASLNEFRGALTDLSAGMMPREVAQAQMEQLTARLAALEARTYRSEGEDAGRGAAAAGRNTQVGLIFAGLGALVAIITVIVAIYLATH